MKKLIRTCLPVLQLYKRNVSSSAAVITWSPRSSKDMPEICLTVWFGCERLPGVGGAGGSTAFLYILAGFSLLCQGVVNKCNECPMECHDTIVVEFRDTVDNPVLVLAAIAIYHVGIRIRTGDSCSRESELSVSSLGVSGVSILFSSLLLCLRVTIRRHYGK